MEKVTKAVLCPVTNQPIALVRVPTNVRKICVAGAYTANGDAVNVQNHRVTANKKMMKTANLMSLHDTHYDASTDTFKIVNIRF